MLILNCFACCDHQSVKHYCQITLDFCIIALQYINMKKITGLLSFLLFSLFVFGQTVTRSYIYDALWASRDHVVDFQHLKLEVSFAPKDGLVKGRVTHTFIPLRPKVDSIQLDGIDMNLKKVVLNGKSAKYKQYGGLITIYCPGLIWEQQDTLVIDYECRPKKGLYFIGWNDKTGICRKQIWSQGQGIDNRHWIPVYDEMNDKITTEMVVTMDSAYKVLSNGSKVSMKSNNDGTNTWIYKLDNPTAPYLIMLGIGKYEIKETKSRSGVPLHLYYYPEWKDRVEVFYQHSERIFDFFESEIGFNYPWPSYSQIPVQDFMYGAMENTTATVFGDFFCVDSRAVLDRNYIAVNAHELAHQWFGDYVTARSDAHHWLQESFATYYNWMAEREVFGQDHYDWGRKTAQENSITESKINDLPIAHSRAGSTRHYPKGAFVLSMLKDVLGGREVYNKCIKHYLTKHPYGSVDSHDLMIACEEVTGISLNWFWDEWVYRGGEPKYNVQFREVNGQAEFSIEQIPGLTGLTGLPPQEGEGSNAVSQDGFVQDTPGGENLQSGLWKMPFELEVYYSDGSKSASSVWIEKQSSAFTIPVPPGKKIAYALFDPSNKVLKSVTFSKSTEMLMAQAMKAPHLLDRFDALSALSTLPAEKKTDFLIKLFSDPAASFYGMKAEILKQLAGVNSKNVNDLFIKAFADPDVQVRKAAMEHAKLLTPALLKATENLLKDPSYEIMSLALEKLAFSNPEKIQDYLELTKNIEGFPGRNVQLKWLEIAAPSSQKYMDQLVSFMSNAYEFRTRVNAISSIKRMNYIDDVAIEYLFDAMLSFNGRLAAPAASTLEHFYDQLRHKREIINYVESKKWSAHDEAIIRKVVK